MKQANTNSDASISRLRREAFLHWLYAIVVGAAALLVAVRYVAPLPALRAPFQLPWPAFIVLFALAQSYVVRFYFRRDGVTFTLGTIPLAIGLIYLSPVNLILAQFLGDAIGLIIYRRQKPLKVVANLGLMNLTTSTGIIVFHAIAAGHSAIDGVTWLALFAAVATIAMVGVLLVFIAVSIADFTVASLLRLPLLIATSLIADFANGSIGLLAATVIWFDARGLFLLLVPTFALFAAYRAYLREHDRHQRLEFLYQSSKILQKSRELDSSSLTLLGHARTMFRCEIAEFILLAEGADARTAVGPDDRVEVLGPVNDVVVAAIRHLLAANPDGVILPRNNRQRELSQLRSDCTITDAIIVPLAAENVVAGAAILANRLADDETFDVEDLNLFKAFASQTGISLENSRLETRLTKQAFEDSLTKLANRALFSDRLVHALQRRTGDNPLVGVLFIDLDDFKLVNDSQGHAAGDALLIAIAEQIRQCLRPFDTAARLGGDEFAVLLEDLKDPRDAIRVAERIVAVLEDPLEIGNTTVNIKASIGVVTEEIGRSTADELLCNADIAMYRAKSRGKGRYELFEATMQTAFVQRHELRSDLQHAIDNNEFTAYYQPVIDLRTSELIGTEALIRWEHPQRRIVYPDTFIPLAEETGLILPIGLSVLSIVGKQLHNWEQEQILPDDFFVSINISARQLEQENFIPTIRSMLEESQVDPQHVVLEITESVMVDDVLSSAKKLEAVRALGLRIAIDDFGTGYSSLRSLQLLPIDFLKVAKEFVDNLGADPASAAFAHAILRLGETLNLGLIAEGVENNNQAELLRSLGCHFGQGYLFSYPLPPSEMDALLRNSSSFAFAELGSELRIAAS